AECFTVEKLKKEGMSAAKIAHILGRSDISIKNCLKRLRLTDNSSYLKRKSSGRKPLEHKNWTKEDWQHVLWTDESSVSTDSNGKIDGQKSIMVWGCVNGYNLHHLVRCPPRMNDEAYGEIIVDAVYPIIIATDDTIFQENRARIHISKSVKKIKAELGIVPMKWPPYSPDL
ncbi:9580_t:CDS:2, partial [Racocetra persica]